jgi:hypothetical protein
MPKKGSHHITDFSAGKTVTQLCQESNTTSNLTGVVSSVILNSSFTIPLYQDRRAREGRDPGSLTDLGDTCLEEDRGLLPLLKHTTHAEVRG